MYKKITGAVLPFYFFFHCFSQSDLRYPLVKLPHPTKLISKIEVPEPPPAKENKPELHSFHSDEIPHFEVLKDFPQNIEKRIYEIKITQDGKYAIFINRWSLSKISLETLKETQFLNHRQLVQGGFTGIGISEDGEKILAGGSWTHKASLYNWSGVGLAHFSCASASFFVYDARLTLKDDQVLILCYDFVN
ncbi:MAG: hypothetical protein N3A69_12005, partial [Leptospiraceae bacterium]|nr:hypothetical protein [Leptospiraceae bacterium]